MLGAFLPLCPRVACSVSALPSFLCCSCPLTRPAQASLGCLVTAPTEQVSGVKFPSCPLHLPSASSQVAPPLRRSS